MMVPVIYQAEIDDGLQEHFNAQFSFIYEIPVLVATNKNYTGKVKNVSGVVGTLSEDEFIYEYPAILVTAGIWNKNDQIFDKFEVWKAKYTPLNKPANLDHQPSQVVGHTNRVFAITDEETPTVIPESVDGKPNMDIPNIFHLLTVDSFYKYNSKPYRSLDENYSDKIQKIYDKVVSGELSVSMECIFSDFDYGIMMADGSQKVIKRTDKTAFLSKKLRKFGGSGEYQGAKIGMLMRDIVFTGKGITDNPANPASVIFSKDSLAFASQNYVKSEDIFKDETNSAYIPIVNGEENMKLEEAQAKIVDLENQLSEAKKVAEELKKSEAALEQANAELNTTKAGLASKTDELNKVVAEKAAVEKSLTEINDKLAVANKELDTIKAEKIKLERVTQIKETLGLDTAEAEKNYVVVASLTSDNFKAWLDNTKALFVAKAKTEAEKDAELAKAKKELEELNKKNAAAQLNTAEAEEPNLGVANVNADTPFEKTLKAVKGVFAKKTENK